MTISDLLPARSGSPAIGSQFPLRSREADALKPRLTAHDLLTSLLGIRSRTRATRAPRAHIKMSVYLPDGRAALAIMLGASKS